MAIAQIGKKVKTNSPVDNIYSPDTNKYITKEIVNSDETVEEIAQYISGSPWRVTYYAQVTALDDEITTLDVNSSDTLSQYTKINDLVITVDNPLSQDKATNLTGGAYVNAGIIPNQGDLLYATLIGGRPALLVVTEVEKNNYNLMRIYHIRYKVYMYIDSDPAFKVALENKVIKTYFYNDNHVNDNNGPLLLKKDFNTKINLRSYERLLINEFFEYNYNKEYNLLVNKSYQTKVADISLQYFIMSIVNTSDSDIIRNMMRIDNTYNTYNSNKNIWDAILTRDESLLSYCDKFYGTTSSSTIYNDPHLRTILYTGIKHLIFTSPDKVKFFSIYNDEDEPKDNIEPSPDDTTEPIDPTLSLLPDINSSGYYVFSKAFYDKDTTQMSIIERLTYFYITKTNAIESDLLIKLVNDRNNWSNREKYYYLPILIILIKEVIKNKG